MVNKVYNAIILTKKGIYYTSSLEQSKNGLPFWDKGMDKSVIKSTLPSPRKNFNLQHRKNIYSASHIPIFKRFAARGAEQDVNANFFCKIMTGNHPVEKKLGALLFWSYGSRRSKTNRPTCFFTHFLSISGLCPKKNFFSSFQFFKTFQDLISSWIVLEKLSS